jgi:hypothetical protein
MSPENSNTNPQQKAVEQVAEAHRILNRMRQQVDKHPDLEEAVAKLEMALSILTTNTGGML